MVVIGLCAIGVATAIVWAQGQRPHPKDILQSIPADSIHEVVINVRPGDSLAAVGEQLTTLGLVDSTQLFVAAAGSRTPPIEGIDPGFYVVAPGRGAPEVVAQLTDPASRVGFLTVQGGRQLDDAIDPATGSVTQGLLSEIAAATCVPTGGGRRCASVDDLRQSAALSDPAALGIPDWAREPVSAMAGDHRRVEGLIGVGRWNFDPTATPAQILSTLITGAAARYDQNAVLQAAAREHGVGPYEVLVVASLLQRDSEPAGYRQAAVEIYERRRRDSRTLPPAPVTVPSLEALAAAEHPNG